MRFILAILLFLQVGIISAQDSIGSYNPEEDEAIGNYSGLEQKMIGFSEKMADFFRKRNPDGYVDGRFSNFFSMIKSCLFLILLHFLHSKLFYRRKRKGADLEKILFRYKVLMIAVAALMTINLLAGSFIWGGVLGVFSFFIIPLSVGTMREHMCPYCCVYTNVEEHPSPLDEFCIEIYDEKTYKSQYLNEKDLNDSCYPDNYKLYSVQKYRYDIKCPECNAKWINEKWERVQEH